jgi:hypothetical protein
MWVNDNGVGVYAIGVLLSFVLGWLVYSSFLTFDVVGLGLVISLIVGVFLIYYATYAGLDRAFDTHDWLKAILIPVGAFLIATMEITLMYGLVVAPPADIVAWLVMWVNNMGLFSWQAIVAVVVTFVVEIQAHEFRERARESRPGLQRRSQAS